MRACTWASTQTNMEFVRARLGYSSTNMMALHLTMLSMVLQPRHTSLRIAPAVMKARLDLNTAMDGRLAAAMEELDLAAAVADNVADAMDRTVATLAETVEVSDEYAGRALEYPTAQAELSRAVTVASGVDAIIENAVDTVMDTVMKSDLYNMAVDAEKDAAHIERLRIEGQATVRQRAQMKLAYAETRQRLQIAKGEAAPTLTTPPKRAKVQTLGSSGGVSGLSIATDDVPEPALGEKAPSVIRTRTSAAGVPPMPPTPASQPSSPTPSSLVDPSKSAFPLAVQEAFTSAQLLDPSSLSPSDLEKTKGAVGLGAVVAFWLPLFDVGLVSDLGLSLLFGGSLAAYAALRSDPVGAVTRDVLGDAANQAVVLAVTTAQDVEEEYELTDKAKAAAAKVLNELKAKIQQGL